MTTMKTMTILGRKVTEDGTIINPTDTATKLTHTPPSKRDVIYGLITDKSKASVIRFTFSETDENDIRTMGEVYVKSTGDGTLLIYCLPDGRLVKQVTRQSFEIVTLNPYVDLPTLGEL